MAPLAFEEFALGLLDSLALAFAVGLLLSPRRLYALIGLIPVLTMLGGLSYFKFKGFDESTVFTPLPSAAWCLGGVAIAWFRIAESIAVLRMLEAEGVISEDTLNLIRTSFARGIRSPAALAVMLYDAGVSASADSVALARTVKTQSVAVVSIVAAGAMLIAVGFGSVIAGEPKELTVMLFGAAVFLLLAIVYARRLTFGNSKPTDRFSSLARRIASTGVVLGLFSVFYNWTQEAFFVGWKPVLLLLLMAMVMSNFVTHAKSANKNDASDAHAVDSTAQGSAKGRTP